VTPFGPEFHAGDLYLPQAGLWLDAHEPKAGAEMVFISHAHGDHIAPHREVILSGPTAQLMQSRLPGARVEHILDFGETRFFGEGSNRFELTLLPAGHIFGSAMAHLQVEGQKLLYTGDFKLRRSLSAEASEPRPADFLIMETTFGRPHYVFPPTEAVLKGIIRFCHEALDNDETPVLLGYSLGKSQELLCGLGEAGLPLVLHGTVFNLTKVYERFGQCFPPYERYEAGSARGKVLLCPPNVINSAMMRNLGKARSAILTGWAVDPNCRFRYQCDAAFPLSDHADFPELLELVRRVEPKRIYTVHGFAADFAQTLRELGYDAQALSEDDQLTLPLLNSIESASPEAANLKRVRLLDPKQDNSVADSNYCKPSDSQVSAVASGVGGSPQQKGPESDSFFVFARTCSQISCEPRKLEKIRLVAEYLRGLRGKTVALAATWFSGRPFPPTQSRVLQLGGAILSEALCGAGKIDRTVLHQIYLKHSDAGETAAEILQHSPLESSLSLQEVNEIFERLYAARGPLAKTPLLRSALERCTPLEAKYLVKIITGDLRIGLKEGLVEEGVAKAFNCPAEEVRQANLVLGDIGETALLAAEHRLSQAALVPFRPIKFMLASPEETAADVWERVQSTRKAAGQQGLVTNESVNADAKEYVRVWLEDKYDGIRCQLHKVGKQVSLYSRDLKDKRDHENFPRFGGFGSRNAGRFHIGR
jgi:DNA ligase-1